MGGGFWWSYLWWIFLTYLSHAFAMIIKPNALIGSGSKKHSIQKISKSTTPITEPNTKPIQVIVKATPAIISDIPIRVSGILIKKILAI